MSVFQKILRAGEGRTLKRMQERVREINAFEPEIERLSDDELRAKADEFRARFDAGEELDDLLPEAFACAREAARRRRILRLRCGRWRFRLGHGRPPLASRPIRCGRRGCTCQKG